MAASDALGDTYEHELVDETVIVWDDVSDDGRSDYDVDEREPYEHDVAVVEPRVWSSDEYIPVGGDKPLYDGPYEASALFTAQSFGTADKLMRKDFAVRAINYTEAPNEYGTTVTIGG